MLLVIDVGNTHTVFGVYDGKELKAHWRLSTSKERTEDEHGVLMISLLRQQNIEPEDIRRVMYASVAPPLNGIIEEVVRRYFQVEPLAVGPGIRTGLKLQFDNPREIGADRIVNAVAGHERYKGPLILVDFGTATTFDYVSADGAYEGGVIAPGMAISAEALFERASKLPKVELNVPRRVLGRNTVNSMQSGIMYGYADMVDGLVRRIQEEIGVPCRVVATGGLAPLMVKICKSLETVDEFLTLEGLRLLHERNSGVVSHRDKENG